MKREASSKREASLNPRPRSKDETVLLLGAAAVCGSDRNAYICKCGPQMGCMQLVMNRINKEYVVSALVHGAVFVLFMLVGNWICHWGMSWVSFLVSGVLYGVVMAWLDRFLEKRIKK